MYGSKCAIMQSDYDIWLRLKIQHAEGIDDPSAYPAVTSRMYTVIFWVDPDEQYSTRLAEGLPDPVWNKFFKLGIDKSMDYKFLNVEVMRHCSWCDPGTSNGSVLVGRARIPLPDLRKKKEGRYGLVRPHGDRVKADGHIAISMEMKKFLPY